MSAPAYTPDEMMTVAAARMLWDGCVCFVGIGMPSAACNLARLTHAPRLPDEGGRDYRRRLACARPAPTKEEAAFDRTRHAMLQSRSGRH